MNLHNRFLWGVASGAGSVVIKTILNILLIPVILHALGADLYGLYVLLVGVTELMLMMDLGFTSAIVKVLGASRCADETCKVQEVLKMGHWLYGSMSLVTLVLGIALIPLFPVLFHLSPAIAVLAKTCLTIALLEGLLTLYTCYYRAILLAHCLHQWANLSDTIFSITGNLIGLVLLLSGFGLPALLLARLGAALVRTFILIFHAIKAEPTALLPKADLRSSTFKEVTGLSLHAMMVNLSVMISHKIDNFVIAAFLPLSMVGIFEIVFRFLAIALQVASKICEVVFPMFSRMVSLARTGEVRHLFLRMSCFSNFVVCMQLLLIVSFYPELFHLFSAGKIPIEPTFPILLVAVPCIWSGTLQMPAGYYLFSSGRQRYLTISSIITAMCNLFLSILLVHKLGLVGVALGTLIPQVIQHQAGLIHETCRDLRISFWEYIRNVHLNIMPSLLGAYAWVQLLHPVCDRMPVPLVGMAFVGLSAMLIGCALWLYTAATHQEKDFLYRILRPVFIKRKLHAVEATHG